MTRLATLLDDPAVRELIYGLGHRRTGESGAARLTREIEEAITFDDRSAGAFGG